MSGSTGRAKLSPRTQAVLEESTIVDTDVHLTVHPEALEPYLDEPYRTRVTDVTYGDPFPSSSWDQWMGGKIDDNWSTFTEAADLEAFCENFYIDYPIVNTFEPLSKFPQADYATSLMRAYNDLLLDRILDTNEDYLGLASIATQQPEKAAEELDRLGDEPQIVGAYIGNTGAQPPLGDPSYDILYQSAEDNDLPIAYHGNGEDMGYEFPRQNQGLNVFLEVHTLAHAWSQMLTLTSLVTEGVPEKFPDLNFLFLEAGIGWVPYLMFRLNKEYSIRRREAPLLEHSPEQYIRESCYFASQPLGEPDELAHMSRIIEVLGTESIMFATDYPHWDFDHPEALDKHLRTHFEPEQRQQVLFDTPVEALKIEALI